MFTGRLRAGENGAEEFGLSSAKRMHDSYRIMSQNDNDRRGGMNEALITVSSLRSRYTRLQIHFFRVSNQAIAH